MIRLLVKLVVAALIASAIWRVGSAYVAHFKFTDAVREAVVYENKGDGDLRARIFELADEFDVPLDQADENAVKIDRDGRHVAIEGSYVKPIEVLPGYLYPWPFSWKIDADVAAPRTVPQLGGQPR